MRIVALSDTHLRHEELDIPSGDMLIHAGDFSMIGKFTDVERFGKWMNDQPHKHKLAIPGNHDKYCQDNMAFCQSLFRPMIFESAGLHTINSLRILCYSWTPAPNVMSPWKFHPEFGNREFFARFWENAPACDILVTHGPPY
jgi:hypothetical protein